MITVYKIKTELKDLLDAKQRDLSLLSSCWPVCFFASFC